MDRLTQSILVALIGGALVALTVSGRFALYVKSGFGPLLLAAGITLMLVGIACVVLAVRSEPVEHRRHAGHDHDRSKAAWLLVLPVLALLLAPPALGTDAVARTAGSQAMAGAPPDPNGPDQIVTGDGGYKPNDGLGAAPSETVVDGQQVRTMAFPPLPAGKNPDVSLSEFVQRALYDPTGSVTTRTVTITGFIAPAGKTFSDDGYLIAQLIISCCAADARAIRVHVDGAAPFPEGTWVTAVVTAYPGSGTAANEYVPTAAIASITRRAQPDDPYGR